MRNLNSLIAGRNKDRWPVKDTYHQCYNGETELLTLRFSGNKKGLSQKKTAQELISTY
jgi:hypothetical protein